MLMRIIDTEYADISTDSIISRGKLRAFLGAIHNLSSYVDQWEDMAVTPDIPSILHSASAQPMHHHRLIPGTPLLSIQSPQDG